MPRPSQNIDAKLIELGKKQMMQNGIANLSIRAICIESKINLGMFFYHFKSKENFIKILLKNYHEDVRNHWFKESEGITNSLDRLKSALRMSARFVKEQRGAFETIFKDMNFSDKVFMESFKEMHASGWNFYSKLITDCQNDSYIDKNTEVEKIFSILTGSVISYAKHCEIHNYENYYVKVDEMIDYLIEKLK